MCSPIPQIHSWLASVMLSSENAQVLLSSVSSSRAYVVCCENGDVASLPGARRSSPCRLAHEVRATNLLSSWVSCVCTLLSLFITFLDGRSLRHCLPVCSLGVVPRVLCILLVVGTQSRSIPTFSVGSMSCIVWSNHVTRAPWAWMTMWYLLPFGTRKLDVPNSSRRSRACENADVAFLERVCLLPVAFLTSSVPRSCLRPATRGPAPCCSFSPRSSAHSLSRMGGAFVLEHAGLLPVGFPRCPLNVLASVVELMGLLPVSCPR